MAQVDTSLERISSLFVDRGLYVLRYDSSADTEEPPIASVRQADGCEGTIQIISAPGAPSGQLPAPGDCVVVLAEAGGALHVSVRRRHTEGSLDATLRLEPLAKAKSLPAPGLRRVADFGGTDEPTRAPRKLQLAVPKFAVMGHVAHRGDIEVDQGEWIAGPESPSPIEGIEIRSAQAPVLIETQVLVSGRSAQWSGWVPPGGFAGTRGRGLPLAGVRFRLRGVEADQYELVTDALFLGSPIMVKRGQEAELISGVAADPLVGLRLDVRRATAAHGNPGEVKTEQLREPRVRVFRAAERR